MSAHGNVLMAGMAMMRMSRKRGNVNGRKNVQSRARRQGSPHKVSKASIKGPDKGEG